ncbi:Protein of unknown function [Lactobacillus helveticus CIRM-BIA 101]|uniref:Uncharacterized protein n=1 Tax=Lactobacillus helveticus CIRM-BIA 104 TaxID=1226333 RepID=U6F8Y9_LACHE|nr:Protein of unknown function [Lactobacillus helveticus CIRM-BIA 104]CDI65381.1 Protein of unknown function [Lactobacillus helveticus CIRM-BIA 101]
MNDFTKNIA